MKKILFSIVALTIITSCQSNSGDPKPSASSAPVASSSPTTTKSLYDRLGGKDSIKAVVDEFVGNVAGDARINKFFTGTAADPARLASFKGLLVDQICEATGGPCKYTGKNMMDAHKGMKISEADFNALVEDLVKALDKFKVPEKEKSDLLAPLAAMKNDIVGK